MLLFGFGNICGGEMLIVGGSQLGQLINPFLATKASEIPNMVLYIAIIVGFPPAHISTIGDSYIDS